MHSAKDTIAAIATPPGRGGVGIVRVSGPGARQLMRGLAGQEYPPRRVHVARFLNDGGELIDRGLVLFFAAPQSFTGEDVLELHAHGGPALLRLLLGRCLTLGARAARPGEFTQRAFLNGKLDLAQAESVADLIEASTGAAARAAARNLDGALSDQLDGLARALLDLRALVEAGIDFPDEEGVELVPDAVLQTALETLRARVARLLCQAGQGRLLRDGLHVVLIGAPNVGKSSLMNCFVGRDVAIVTPIPGTTRDALRESLEIEGVPLHLVDTAGLRPTTDEIEVLGMQRTRSALSNADLALVVIAPPMGSAALGELVSELPDGLPRLIVHNKIDLDNTPGGLREVGGETEIGVSAKTGAGIEALRQAILKQAGWTIGGEEALMSNPRQFHALRRVGAHLGVAAELIAQRELFAEELRGAEGALNEIHGVTLPEALLGVIFQRFCVGK